MKSGKQFMIDNQKNQKYNKGKKRKILNHRHK